MKKILVIEDNEHTADFLELVLCEQYNVIAKRNVINIVPVISQFMPDLILISNEIGLRNAAEILSEIRDTDYLAHLPFILLSAQSDIAHTAKEIQADAFLAKPFKLTDLCTCIEQVVEALDTKLSSFKLEAVCHVTQAN